MTDIERKRENFSRVLNTIRKILFSYIKTGEKKKNINASISLVRIAIKYDQEEVFAKWIVFLIKYKNELRKRESIKLLKAMKQYTGPEDLEDLKNYISDLLITIVKNPTSVTNKENLDLFYGVMNSSIDNFL